VAPRANALGDYVRARHEQVRPEDVEINKPAPTPKDATEATEEQQELQDKLDHQDDDPEAPGRRQSRAQVADET